jgi:hypothetical protein
MSRDFAAHDLTSALDRATHMVPYGYNLWKVELAEDKEFSFNKFIK